ncbi:alpha-tocopherol transfer protein [Trichonephila clavata]|uniref:Alpha-tocopherol transfer protein n=1 Tax=Trichonephila clavata TaxID=2740835 RepID=A0A8X6H503_TRICU|nr:alpha-tocopherol transfer protein [Trichonephila clavata]
MTSNYEETMKAKGYLPYHLDHIPSKMIQIAKEELNETNETRAAALDKIRKYIKKERNLKCPMEDEYLLQFLRARKFDAKRAFSLLQNKYQVKKSYPELYDSINLDDLRKVYSSGAGYCYPFRDPDGCVVMVLSLDKWNPGESNICHALTALTGLLLNVVDTPATQISGVRILVDVRGFSFRQMWSLTPRYILLLSRALRNCLPVRFKGIHIYNESNIFQNIWLLLKIVLTDKIKNRVHFHGDNQKQLQKFIPKDILSAEYGGEKPDFNAGEWCCNEMEPFYEKFLAMVKCGYF